MSRSVRSGLSRFADSGLTRAALRGGDFFAADEWDTEARIATVSAAAGRGDRSLVYVYERQLDHAGHVHGCESSHWLAQLSRIDDFCERLRAALPARSTVIITGDHGMVDVPAGHRLVVEDVPALQVGVERTGRRRPVPAAVPVDPRRTDGRWPPGGPMSCRDRAWVRTRTEAIEDGWFGPVEDGVLERYGHVLVAMREDWAVMSRRYPRELSLVGMHGSLTPAEMTVPLFFD